MLTALSRFYLALWAALLFGCTSPSTAPSTDQRSVHQDPQTKVCTERPPASYTSSVENRLKAELPLLGKTEAQAEGTVKSYLEQKSGGTKRGDDLGTYLFYVCQMANNGGWNQDRTERLVTLFINKWPDQEHETTAPDHKCMEQLQSGYALKDSIEEEYWRTRKDGTFQSQREEFIKKWKTDAGKWTANTETVLVEIGGPIAKGRFRNASIPSTGISGTNDQWNGIKNQLQGRLIVLEAICKAS